MFKIKKNIKLSEYSTFRIGGEAKFFVEVSDEKELLEVLNYAEKKQLNFFILGGGSNILFSDNGFDGMVIKIKNKKSEIRVINKNSKFVLDVPAGCSLNDVVSIAKENDLSGMENLAGIPGTIGGAIWGNAGAFGVCFGDLVQAVRVFNIASQKIKSFSQKECQFGYRKSIFKEKNNLKIVSVSFYLKKGEKKEIEEKIKEILKTRSEKQPKDWKGTAGSFFKNPAVDKKELIAIFEKEKGVKIKDGKLPAGWLISEAGFSGKEVGGARVSEKNANFIINTGKATAEDVIILASLIKQKVRNEFGIELMEEVQYVGF